MIQNGLYTSPEASELDENVSDDHPLFEDVNDIST